MRLKYRIKTSTVMLWGLIILSIILALKTSGEPILEILRDTWMEPWFQRLPTGNAILFNLSIGFLVSWVFYLLVVWFPDRRRKNLITNNLAKQYRSFKEDAISIFLKACQQSNRGGSPDNLTDLNVFRNYFNESVSDSQNRWHAVANGLNDRLLQDLLVEFEILLNEVTYVLNNVNIEDPDVFSFFKRLSQTVYRMNNSALDYDDVKHLLRFLWELFTGWSFKDGYRDGEDIVAVMIEDI